MQMKHLLQGVAEEIQSLRQRNTILQAKVDVLDVFAAALLGPRRETGMAPDVLWALRKEISKLEASEVPQAVNDVAPGPKPVPRSPGDREVG